MVGADEDVPLPLDTITMMNGTSTEVPSISGCHDEAASTNKNEEKIKARSADLGDRLSVVSLGLQQRFPQRQQQQQMVKIHLILLLVLLVACLAVANGTLYVLIDKALLGREWHLQLGHRDPADNDAASIVRDTVPFVREWYAHLGNAAEPLLPFTNESLRLQREELGPNEMLLSRVVVETDTSGDDHNGCVHRWFSVLLDTVPSITLHDAAAVLESMGLLDVPDIVKLFRPKDGSITNTSTKEYFLRASRCLSESRTISEMACVALQRHPGGGLGDNEHAVRTLAARAIVLDVLTEALLDNFMLQPIVIDRMKGKQRELFTAWVADSATQEFWFHKYDGLVVTLHSYINNVKSNQGSPESAIPSLQTNILEAVKLDIVNGYHQNARVGVALAAALSIGNVAVGPSYEDHRMKWPLGQGWVEAYMAWNLAFVSGLARSAGIPFPVLALKLMIPSVSCEMALPTGERFVERRLTSLALFLLGQNEKSMGKGSTRAESGVDRSFVERFGEQNAKTMKIPSPSRKTVETMFSDLCGQGKVCIGSQLASETSPTFAWGPEQYRVFSGFVLLVTMMLTGFGLECFALWAFLFAITSWSARTEFKWRLAQFLFSIMALISLGLAYMRNALGAMTTVLCLWKVGFPECVTYVYTGLFAEKESKWRRASLIANGVGLAMHHCAASVIIAMLIAGVVSPGRQISDPVSFLVMQHWFVLLRYVSIPAYFIVELVLEVLFEWSAIASLERLFLDHWSGAVGAATMVLAHWLFAFAALLELVAMSAQQPGKHSKCGRPWRGMGVLNRSSYVKRKMSSVSTFAVSDHGGEFFLSDGDDETCFQVK